MRTILDKFTAVLHFKSDFEDLKHAWRRDMLSGFWVFLIALPLSLGIAAASGFPPSAGIISAIIGGLLVSRISGSTLTINGPAAGLIIVVLSAVQALGEGDPIAGYRYTLAAIVISGGLQVLLGRLRWGQIITAVPSAVVHGMLAAIGLIIIISQLPVLVGAPQETGTVLHKLLFLSHSFAQGQLEIMLISLVGFWLLLLVPLFDNKLPMPLIVVAVGSLFAWHFSIPVSTLVSLPENLSASFYTPDFSKIHAPAFWEAVISLCLIGSLETLLSAAAIDKLDPQQRRTDLDRDLRAIGCGNMLAGAIGGLPMIAEIVRSSANVNNGAQTAWANFFHGLFLLLFVAMFPQLIQTIPLAALAVLLVFTGYRLAEPKVWVQVYQVGQAQLLVFSATLLGVLLTDLLLGVLIGIGVKLLVNVMHGVWWRNLFNIYFEISSPEQNTQQLTLKGSALFSNFLPLKAALLLLPKAQKLKFDFTQAYLIDHTVMEFLQQFTGNYEAQGGHCEFIGEAWQKFSPHQLAARLMTADERKA